MTTILYGIANCDSVKKAKNWLNDHGVLFEFHDYKKLGVPRDKLSQWIDQAGIETVCNKRGTTWRKLNESQQAAIEAQESAIDLLAENSSLIKRPILENGATLIIGFDATRYTQELA